ncbi:hypothetical protein RND71_006400 [Anisodus tanguticus]|uniref:Isopenicillin N synthase-like Fe(2+) 2OG dioxygenase domain-containing protein n=1 Tax=Anisodus tanguticus TaxID=243964 RepID=A0AAE1SU63_9SOLA|nr:hypothetical protein RND71_006400 [Anisodus tanguticus]
MAETMKVCKEFFALLAEEKEKLQPKGKPAKFELPLEQKAKIYIEGEQLSNEEGVVAKYSVEVRKLTMRMLDYIYEGLGLKLGYFDNELSKIQMMLTNYYPPCPDPSSTLGSGGHSDGNLITLLQQDLPGLQQLIVKDGN